MINTGNSAYFVKSNDDYDDNSYKTFTVMKSPALCIRAAD